MLIIFAMETIREPGEGESRNLGLPFIDSFKRKLSYFRINLVNSYRRREKNFYNRKGKSFYYNSKENYSIVIEDSQELFSPVVHKELARFLDEDLLHDKLDILSLLYIRIDKRDSRDLGSWCWAKDEQSGREGGVIFLNARYLKTSNALKTTLAHEYGHHWTITNCVRHHWHSIIASGAPVNNERLPQQYYSLRGLSTEHFFADISRGWNFCDREVIAEDYKVLFSPHPINERHFIIDELIKMRLHNLLDRPSSDVAEYIRNLKYPSS